MQKFLIILYIAITFAVVIDIFTTVSYGINLSGAAADRVLLLLWVVLSIICVIAFWRKKITKILFAIAFFGVTISVFLNFKSQFNAALKLFGFNTYFMGPVLLSNYCYEINIESTLNIFEKLGFWEKKIISTNAAFLHNDRSKIGLSPVTAVKLAKETPEQLILLVYAFDSVPNRITINKKSGEIIRSEYDPESITKQNNKTIEDEGWKPLKGNLWRDKNGNIGYKTIASVGNEENNYMITLFLTEVTDEDQNIELKKILDTTTYQEIGNTEYFKDKNHVYQYYAMLGGGFLSIVKEADVQSFHNLGGCFAADKNFVYYVRHGAIKDADVKTFRTAEGINCIGKDKNGYFSWENRISLKELEDEELQKEMMDKIKKL